MTQEGMLCIAADTEVEAYALRSWVIENSHIETTDDGQSGPSGWNVKNLLVKGYCEPVQVPR